MEEKHMKKAERILEKFFLLINESEIFNDKDKKEDVLIGNIMSMN